MLSAEESKPRTERRLAGPSLNSNDPHSLITQTNETENSLFNQLWGAGVRPNQMRGVGKKIKMKTVRRLEPLAFYSQSRVSSGEMPMRQLFKGYARRKQEPCYVRRVEQKAVSFQQDTVIIAEPILQNIYF